MPTYNHALTHSHTHTPIHLHSPRKRSQDTNMKLVKILLMVTLAAVVLCLGFVMVNGIRTAAAKTTMSGDAVEQIEKVVTGSIPRGSASGQGSVSHDITGSAADKHASSGAVGTIPHPPPPPPYQSPKLSKSPSIPVPPLVPSKPVPDLVPSIPVDDLIQSKPVPALVPSIPVDDQVPSLPVVPDESKVEEDTGTRSKQYSLATNVKKTGKVKDGKKGGSWISFF